MERITRRDPPMLRLCRQTPEDPGPGLMLLVAEHAALRRLCDRLEAIADDLPRLPPPEERHAVRATLRRLVPRHGRHEQALLARLFPDPAISPIGRRMLDYIHAHHALDELHAQDLDAALETGLPDTAEALGYMLRCFFDGCRRALAFEELVMLMLSRQHLPPATQAALARVLGTIS